MAARVLTGARAEAKAKGLKCYIPEKPCIRGHRERGVSNGRCIECITAYNAKYKASHAQETKDYMTAWYAARDASPEKSSMAKVRRKAYMKANAEKVNATRKRYMIENADKVAAVSKARYARTAEKQCRLAREWIANNPERVKQTQKLHRVKNRARIKKREQEYRAANALKIVIQNAKRYDEVAEERRAYAVAWRKVNKEAVLAYGRNRHARKREAEGSHTAAEVKALLLRQKGLCAYCRTTILKKRHVDHIMPLKRGGSNWISNIQLLCQPCNNRKAAKHPADFARQLGLLI